MGNTCTGNTKHRPLTIQKCCEPPSVICTLFICFRFFKPEHTYQRHMYCMRVCTHTVHVLGNCVSWRNRTDLFMWVVHLCLCVYTVYLCVCVYFLSGGGDVASSRFIRPMQPGNLFQIGESATLYYDLSPACSIFFPSFPLYTQSILHQFSSLPPSSASTMQLTVLSFVCLFLIVMWMSNHSVCMCFDSFVCWCLYTHINAFLFERILINLV